MKQIQESGEMYLETILRLTESGKPVRSIDVAEEMNYSKPSVSRAVGILRSRELITIDPLGGITLTARGKSIAEKIYERHNVLTAFLMGIGVDADTAMADACKMEHDISDKTLEAIKRAVQSEK